MCAVSLVCALVCVCVCVSDFARVCECDFVHFFVCFFVRLCVCMCVLCKTHQFVLTVICDCQPICSLKSVSHLTKCDTRVVNVQHCYFN